ncbi:hypothetical protein GJB62_27595 [Nostoc sp. ATCC 53789]|nr:hypothetical protein [Nostoc sp. ATCC 53789]QHG19352.1 hypothetical protein GJB62_27595 [Nostoc sp. ATCC 53789]
MTLFVSELTQNISQIPIPLHLCDSLRQGADAPSLRDAARTSLPLR